MTGERDAADGFDVTFVGRANIDLTVRVPHRAGPGRTAAGSALTTSPGGKSLNQAVATARLGGRARLVANVGADAWGHRIRAALTAVGVDTRHLTLIPDVTTGAAIIEVTPDGESYITLAPSPATELTTHDVQRVTTVDTRAVVVQLDLPPEPVAALLRHRPAPTVIGNLVLHADLDRTVLRHLDVLVVNQHEADAILGAATGDPLRAAEVLQRLGPPTVVVTAGPRGAAYTHPHGSGTVPAPTVPVVDTTGAGDAFLGSLALDLARGTPLPEAVRGAVQVGSRAVAHSGANTAS
ncbi:ribokinase [Micromonospora sp. 15K316]|uniref:ribokinase n=1 Tax=Micromonospora sp. 15K316 TaxID=2530376 RepID=UPI00104513A1|nr:ribokinase [Micromonospora sp. 15K316]TDC38787.1 ribokinase [Micromonospora sp. 15K316]